MASFHPFGLNRKHIEDFFVHFFLDLTALVNFFQCTFFNTQRIARRRVNAQFGNFNKDLYFDESLDAKAIEKEFNRNS